MSATQPIRILAIDWGTRRFGLAIGDTLLRLASPLEVIQISTPQLAIDRIVKIISTEGIDQILIGLPLHMDGTSGNSAEQAKQFGDEISAATKLPVIFMDERLSSFQAESAVTDRKRHGEKITRGGKRKLVDALAAAGFLQAYLDQL
jgi:putative Holliday junction resolvase